MKLATDLVKAILIRNGVEPVNISESSKLSLKQPLTELKFSLYLRTEHLSHFLPDYVYSIKECPLSYDIGIEIQKIFESLHLLNEEFESLGFVSVWIEMHQSISEQSRFKKSNFAFREEEVELAKGLVCSHNSKISNAAYFWLQHFEEFMIYVRNKLIDLFREAYDLILGMQQVFFIREKEELLKTISYGNDLYEVKFMAAELYSIEQNLKCSESISTKYQASAYINRIREFVRSGWRQGYIVCHHKRSNQISSLSLPMYLKDTSGRSARKRVKRLISSTVCGRNKDLGLTDF
ncbi:TPA: hypothetical protein I3776_002692 [Enterobacter cloacae]|nr:hypothetical protein [Enterobacter cloacae]